MLLDWWAWAVRLLLAATAFTADAAEGLQTPAPRPAHTYIVQAAEAAPSESLAPVDSQLLESLERSISTGTPDLLRRENPLSSGATDSGGPTDLAALLAQQERARQAHPYGAVVAVACASAIPGVLLGIAFWFAVLWYWNRRDILPASVAGICSAASIFTLVTVPETADLWQRLFSPSTLQAIEAISLSLLGIFGLLFLYLLYPYEVAPVRFGRIELKPPAAGAVAGSASCGGGAGLTASSSSTRFDATTAPPSKPVDSTASADESEEPAQERRRLLNTALLLSPTLALGLAAAAALIIPVQYFGSLMSVYDLLILPTAVAVGIFLVGIVRRRRRFSTVITAAYGAMAILFVHDMLVRSGALWGSPAVPYAFAPFLAVIGWTTVGHSVGRWKEALQRSWSQNQELETRYATAVAEARSLESAQQMQQRFVASTSHELRSPLTSILGFTELLEEELSDDLAPSHRGFIQSIRESAHRLLHLVNDLLDLARAEDAGLEMRFSAVDVDEVVDDAVRHIYPLAQVKRLAMYLEKEGLGSYVWADNNRLRQVIMNLLSNAVKFTTKGRVMVRVRSASLSGTDEPAVAIEIEDTGRGISADFLPHLFERFAREDDTAYEGSGLGLAISKEFVEGMGGEIRVESRLGEGSRFTVLLPQARREDRKIRG